MTNLINYTIQERPNDIVPQISKSLDKISYCINGLSIFKFFPQMLGKFDKSNEFQTAVHIHAMEYQLFKLLRNTLLRILN